MKLTGDTILITGGSEGIGFALAQTLVSSNTVIICGRSEEKLKHAKSLCNGLHTEICDVTDVSQRQAMVQRLLRSYPQLNVLINNAGAKRRTDLLTHEGVDAAMIDDMALNFTAPAALCAELLPHLQSCPRAGIVNMTTGLVHLPKAEQAFYCAAKAALHSYTQSLGWALRQSAVEVYEVSLPLVNTNFHQQDLPKNFPAMQPDEAAHKALRGIRKGKKQVYVGKASLARWLSVIAPDKGMAIVNK
ncbi:MAG: SDR family NAD(P)-dependent oxidoreductase [Amphritea sp.]